MSNEVKHKCPSCDGYGHARLAKKDGTYFEGLQCVMCKGTGTEHINLPCLECGKPMKLEHSNLPDEAKHRILAEISETARIEHYRLEKLAESLSQLGEQAE